MMESEFGSTGAAEISAFHKLLLEKGRNPPRLAFWPGAICWQELLVPPVPPEPPEPPPEPPDPPLPPEPLLDDAVVEPPHAVRNKADKRRQANTQEFQGERGWNIWALFFRVRGLGERERRLWPRTNQDTYRGNMKLLMVLNRNTDGRGAAEAFRSIYTTAPRRPGSIRFPEFRLPAMWLPETAGSVPSAGGAARS